VGDPEGDGQLLLDQQDGDPAARDLGQEVADQADQHGGQALGRLVDHDQLGVAHEGAADGQHLLLAAGEHAARGVGPLAKGREEPEGVLERPAGRRARGLRAAGLHPQDQVLADGQTGEDVPVLRHVAEASAGDRVRGEPGQLLPLEPDRAAGRDVAHDGLDGGGAADPVAAEEAHDLPPADVEGDAVQDVALAVEGVEVPDLEHQDACSVPR
jgi:hypothetical protein